eukprot:CAMPEP_0117450174 /NCGR_PEP_ID=MMETSP0759-20121206/8328_1 /TAXON_ID=63605 /ORGANISM="Percolomonas cosmopolitus, Strain WS" /LENGTH=691 /DNA_ID=CAMNT_0005242679 /DNA_START=131 /DNA_END=2203 /DNA_ORIENTATION=+
MSWNPQWNNIGDPQQSQNNWNPQQHQQGTWNPQQQQQQGAWNPQQQQQQGAWNPQQQQQQGQWASQNQAWNPQQQQQQYQQNNSPQQNQTGWNQSAWNPQQQQQQNPQQAAWNANPPPNTPSHQSSPSNTPSNHSPSPSLPAYSPPVPSSSGGTSAPSIVVTANDDDSDDGVVGKVKDTAKATFSTTQKVVSLIKRIVLTIVFLSGPLVAVISLLLSLSAFAALIGTRNNLDSWLDNANRKSITGVMLGTSSECTAAGYTPWSEGTILAKWPGISDRCDCRDISLSTKDVKRQLYVGNTCSEKGKDYVNAGCKTYVGADSKILEYIPVGAGSSARLICVKRDGPSIFDTIFPDKQGECEEGFQICGSKPGNLTNSAICEKSCSLLRNIHLDRDAASVTGNTSYPNGAVVEFTMSEYEFCTQSTSGTPDRAYPQYLKSSGIGTGGRCSIRDTTIEEFGDIGELDLFQANNVPLNASAASNTYRWKLGFKRRNPWLCSPFNAEANGNGVLQVSSLGPNMAGIDALFWCQVALFVISLGLSIVVSIAIPALLIWNGHLKKLWCGHSVLREGDRDDLSRYGLCALVIKFFAQAVQFVPIVIVIVIAYTFKNYWSYAAAYNCSTTDFNESIRYFSGRLNKAAGWMNIVMLVFSVLGFSVTVLSCCCCWKNVILNVVQGRPAFKRRFAVVGDPDFEM